LLGSREAASADGDVPTTALDLAVELMTSKQITARIITKSQSAEEGAELIEAALAKLPGHSGAAK